MIFGTLVETLKIERAVYSAVGVMDQRAAATATAARAPSPKARRQRRRSAWSRAMGSGIASRAGGRPEPSWASSPARGSCALARTIAEEFEAATERDSMESGSWPSLDRNIGWLR